MKHSPPLSIDETFALIAHEIRSIADGTADPYSAGTNIHSLSILKSAQHNDCWYLSLLWGAFTDLVDEDPSDEALAVELMKRASREWIELRGNRQKTDEYFQRWLFEELRYER